MSQNEQAIEAMTAAFKAKITAIIEQGFEGWQGNMRMFITMGWDELRELPFHTFQGAKSLPF